MTGWLRLLDWQLTISQALQNRQPRLCSVASARALMTRTLPKGEFLRATRNMQVGHIIQVEALIRSLVRLGYEPVNTVVLPGQYARRGGIVDVWPPAEAQPTRLEFFGDEIDTLRSFDPATQRTSKTQSRLLVTPAREYLLTDEHLDLQEQVDIDEFHIPQLHQTSASLLDYLPRQATGRLGSHIRTPSAK